jgi:hypothetical protein
MSGIDLSQSPKLHKYEWQTWVERALLFLFGKLANVLRTGVAYSVPDVVPADYTPVLVPLAVKELKEQKKLCLAERMKKVYQLKEKEPSFYVALWAMNDENCQNILTDHPSFKGIRLDQDANQLVLLMRL